MKNLNEKIVSHIPVPLITKNKQSEIKNKMELENSICDQIEKMIDQTLLKAEALRQSILKKVFEGRLI